MKKAIPIIIIAAIGVLAAVLLIIGLSHKKPSSEPTGSKEVVSITETGGETLTDQVVANTENAEIDTEDALIIELNENQAVGGF